MSNKVIEEHRKMLILSKNVSDFQLNNIKAWCFLFFEGVKSAEIAYNFVNEYEDFYSGSITIRLDLDSKAKQAKVKYDNFVNSIKYLFFYDTQVKIYKNGKIWNFKSTPTTSTKKKKSR